MNQEHFIHTPESLAEPHDSVLAIQLFKLRAALDHLIRHMIFQATGQNIDRILNPLSLVNMALTTPELRSVEVIQSQLSALQLADTQLTQLYAKLLETYQKSIDIMLALNELINTLPTVVGELCTILEELSAQEAFGALSANGSYLLKGPTAVSPDLAGTMAEKILNELHAQTFRSLTTNQPQFPVIIQNDEIITIPSVLQKGIDTEQLPQLPIALESYSLERGNAELVRNFNHNPQKTTREVMHTLSATVERIFNSAYLSSHNGQQLWLSPDDIQTEKERVLQTLNSDSRNLIPLLEQYTKEGDLLAGVSAILEKVLFRSDIAAVYTDTRTNDGLQAVAAGKRIADIRREQLEVCRDIFQMIFMEEFLTRENATRVEQLPERKKGFRIHKNELILLLLFMTVSLGVIGWGTLNDYVQKQAVLEEQARLNKEPAQYAPIPEAFRGKLLAEITAYLQKQATELSISSIEKNPSETNAYTMTAQIMTTEGKLGLTIILNPEGLLADEPDTIAALQDIFAEK